MLYLKVNLATRFKFKPKKLIFSAFKMVLFLTCLFKKFSCNVWFNARKFSL